MPLLLAPFHWYLYLQWTQDRDVCISVFYFSSIGCFSQIHSLCKTPLAKDVAILKDKFEQKMISKPNK